MVNIICSRCKCEKELSNYVVENGDVKKTCITCRNEKRIPKKCDHDKFMSNPCKECNRGYCIHGRRKTRCKDCGTGYCQHGKRKLICKMCNDPRKITVEIIINGSRNNDKKYFRYDPEEFIDKIFIENLIDESIECHYCGVEMQFLEFDDTLCTIERLDNSKGHVKNNCVLACKKCNLTRPKK